MNWLEWIKVVLPAALTAATAVFMNLYFEPRKQEAARKLRVDEKRFDAQQALVSALTRLDLATAEYCDGIVHATGNPALWGKAIECHLALQQQIANARFSLTDAQYEAVVRFSGGWHLDLDECEPHEPPTSQPLVREHFGPDAALKLQTAKQLKAG
jgi:hypothetical protein